MLLHCPICDGNHEYETQDENVVFKDSKVAGMLHIMETSEPFIYKFYEQIWIPFSLSIDSLPKVDKWRILFSYEEEFVEKVVKHSENGKAFTWDGVRWKKYVIHGNYYATFYTPLIIPE